MADKTLSDIGRRELDFTGNLISEALPEWFREDNPKLITLLEKYHENLDSDGNFGQRLKTIPTLRDIAQTDTENLTFIEDELLLGQNYFKGTLDARTSASLSNNFYRSKGTKFGIERFFNMFFGEIPDIVYGKDLTFQIGSDEIGPGTEKRITDATIYQFWGILIKFGRSTNEWLDLYKLFAHPAGMFVGAEIAIETKNADISFDQMPDKGIDESPNPQFVGLASAAPFARQNLSGIIGKLRTPYNVDPANPTQTGWPADSDGITYEGSYRIDFDRVFIRDFADSAGAPSIDLRLPFETTVDYGSVATSTSISLDKGSVASATSVDSDYGSLSINQFPSLGYLDNTYNSVVDAVRMSSPTIDEDSDATNGVMRFSNVQRTMDEDEFKYYLDSTR